MNKAFVKQKKYFPSACFPRVVYVFFSEAENPISAGMEQDRDTRLDLTRAALEKSMSLVDCLFEMPANVAKRVSEADRSAGARLEARLSAEIRTVIAARLRSDEAA